MSLTVVLAVGLDSWLLTAHSKVWRSEGFIVVSAASIREAIGQFRAGDFDLVLLGDSISKENRERLIFLIRDSGSRTPVVCVANAPGDFDLFADVMRKNDSGMGELSAENVEMRRGSAVLCGAAS